MAYEIINCHVNDFYIKDYVIGRDDYLFHSYYVDENITQVVATEMDRPLYGNEQLPPSICAFTFVLSTLKNINTKYKSSYPYIKYTHELYFIDELKKKVRRID